MTTKTCRKCEQLKPFADFPKGRDSNGLYYICKLCTIARSQKRYYTMDKLDRWINATVSDVQGRAKRKGVYFNLTKQQLRDLFTSQCGKCAYCTVPFELTNTRYARRSSPSVDRLVPSDGYTMDNVTLCCHRCNAIKQDATPQELLTLTTAVFAVFSQRGLPTAGQAIPSQIA